MSKFNGKNKEQAKIKLLKLFVLKMIEKALEEWSITW